jgi:molybdate transport system substrate-binding protein
VTALAAAAATVFAAASLSNVFPQIDGGSRYSFGGSDQLALQLRQGAPADVYAAARPKYAELLYRDDIVRKPFVFATNRLVVLVPRANPGNVRSVYDLRRKGLRVVIGDRTVPVGSYTRQLLDALGIADDVLKNVVSQETDAKGIVVAVPAWAQPPIRYEVAVVAAAPHPAAARAFVKRVLSVRGRLLLRRAGFGLPRR